MEAASAFFEARSSTSWNYDALKNFRIISPVVQSHLQRVYATLTAALFVSVLGCAAHLYWNIGGRLTFLAVLVSGIWLAASSAYGSNERTRLKLLAAVAFFEGASVGPLVELVININSSLVITAFLGTVVVFGCFTGAALLARRREYLFLGGALTTALGVMLTLRFCAYLFGASVLYYSVEIYGGLLVFVGYILFDTQMIIEKADRGDLDYVTHALDLFLDFVGIFVRILVILTKNECEKDRKEDKKRKR